jgi:hypothetical protein
MLGIFSLPLELREEVYALVFTTHHMCTEDKLVVRIRKDATPDRPPPALMLTCKQIYQEAQSLFIMSLKFVITDNAGLESLQQWLGKKDGGSTTKSIRAVAFTSCELFRTFSPSERRMKWERQKGMPWVPRQEWTTVYFTSSNNASSTDDDTPMCIQLVQTLPGLQYVEIGLDCHAYSSTMGFNSPHYYDFGSLTTIPTLKTVKINLRLRAVRWNLYKSYLEREANMRSQDRSVKAVLDDGMGLRSWLEGTFREAGSLVEVHCVCYGLGREA